MNVIHREKWLTLCRACGSIVRGREYECPNGHNEVRQVDKWY